MKRGATKRGDDPWSGARNLGPVSTGMLEATGISSLASLRQTGAARAYWRVRQSGQATSLNLLWALEGAILDEDWKRVSRVHRSSLLLALDDIERHEGGPPVV